MTANSCPHVLVIGAGISGLGAARHLQHHGASVTVIEARDLIGGRTRTSHLWPDLAVDMGASWVHGVKNNPIAALARDLGQGHTPAPYDRWATFDAEGRLLDVATLETDCTALIDRARQRARSLGRDISIQAAIQASPEWTALSPQDRAVMRMIIATRIEHEYSGDWSQLSAWCFDDDEDFEGGDIFLNQGYGPLTAHLALGLDIRLSEPVTSIRPDGTGVEVRTTTATHRADHVIVTLPLGVLKSGAVDFGAPLAPDRQRAIDRLGVGLLNKCWLRFDRVFWPPEPDMINFLGPETALWAEWVNAYRFCGQPLLVGFNGSDKAEEVEKMDDRATTASAMAALRAMFGSAVPDPVGAQITRWRQDIHARGSYSFVPVGGTPKDRQALAGSDWQGRLWFAGEATSPLQGATSHGALTSGHVAAKGLLLAATPA